MRLTPIDARLTGTVRDERGTAIAGATVAIVLGPPTGKSATTDAAGAYTIVGIYGGFTVRVTKDGYQPEERSMTTGQYLSPNFVLKPL